MRRSGPILWSCWCEWCAGRWHKVRQSSQISLPLCPPAGAVLAALQTRSVLPAEPSSLLQGAVISHLNGSRSTSTSTVAVFFTTIRADISCLHKEGTSISLCSLANLAICSRGRWLQIKLVHRWDYKCNSSIMRIKREKGIAGFMAVIWFVLMVLLNQCHPYVFQKKEFAGSASGRVWL